MSKGAGKVLVCCALEMEARAIAREWREAKGSESSSPVVLVVGIRAVRLKQSDIGDFKCIIMAGLGGGLDPDLKIGDVVIDDAAGLISEACEENLSAAVNWRRGKIHTVDTIVATPAEKAELFRRSGAAAVDMENAAVRAMAKKAGVAFLGIRAISDTANQSVSPKVVGMVDEFGRPKILELAKTLLRKPGLFGELMRLGEQSKRAATAMGKAVRMVVKGLDLQQ
jgi:nucleoside phosphorylase